MTGPSGLGDNMKIDTEMLCSFIDGELDAATAAAVRAALETDENLRRDYEDLRKTAELVRGLPKVSAPPELAEAITVQAERDQLLGQAPPVPAVRSRLYWGLSVAASLLVGVAVGIFGYHAWRGQPGLSGEPAEPTLVMSKKDRDLSEGFYAGKAAPSSQPGPSLTLDGRDMPGEVDEEIAALTKTGRGSYLPKSKSSTRIARTGSEKGAAAKSSDGARGPLAKGSPVKAKVATVQPAGRIAAAEGTTQQELTQTGEDTREDLALKYRGGRRFDTEAPGFGGSLVDDVDVERGRAGLAKLPLERQVILNNYVNQTMTANLKFAAEPLNVRVVSNDTAKTLQYVQQWAARNSLIDLNEASARINLPVYAQVIYEGTAGTNIEASQDNGVLVRTSRFQARQIIADLQQQKPLVVSVSVKDEKNSLGLELAEREQKVLRGLGYVAGLPEASSKAGIVSDDQPVTQAIQEKELAQKGVSPGHRAAGTRKDADKEGEAASELKRQYAEFHRAPADKLRADGSYLFQITNQRQVRSLEDLVTLVVLVEDAKRAAIMQPASQTAPPAAEQSQPQAPQTEPEATESE